VFTILPISSGAESSVRGYVSHRISGCDYFLVQTRTGYDLLEWFGGYDPDKGDVIIGRYEEYGFHDVLDDTADESIHVYTEEYWLSKSDALEKLTDKCE
jgi:hypothetical protein